MKLKPSKANGLYNQRRLMRAQASELEHKIQKFIEGLYETLPPEWKQFLAENNVLTQVFEFGRSGALLDTGSSSRFGSDSEAWQKCQQLKQMLAEYMTVLMVQHAGFIELTFVLDHKR